MKMSKQLEAAFNAQIAAEFHSAHAYLQMSANAEVHYLPGIANWFRMQAEEERFHAMKFYDFMLARGNEVELVGIPAPDHEIHAPLQMFRLALSQERSVTESIGKLYAMATEEADYPSYSLLQWFINEQVEEESSIGLIVARLEMVGEDKTALLLIDSELGARAPESRS
jgi:ferritin